MTQIPLILEIVLIQEILIQTEKKLTFLCNSGYTILTYSRTLKRRDSLRLSRVLPCWLDCGMCDGRVTRAMLAFASLTRTLRAG